MKVNYAALIRQSLDMGEVAQYYGLQFNRAGFAPCPFHNEKTPSFKIHNNHGHCFGCGWHNDSIGFVMELFGLDFPAAIAKLNTDFSIGIPLGRRSTLREKRDAERKYREIVAERARVQAEKQAYEGLYHALWDEWHRLDRGRLENAPQTPDDDWHPLFVEALHRIDHQEYLIDLLL